jgi:hypothetical protein
MGAHNPACRLIAGLFRWKWQAWEGEAPPTAGVYGLTPKGDARKCPARFFVARTARCFPGDQETSFTNLKRAFILPLLAVLAGTLAAAFVLVFASRPTRVDSLPRANYQGEWTCAEGPIQLFQAREIGPGSDFSIRELFRLDAAARPFSFTIGTTALSVLSLSPFYNETYPLALITNADDTSSMDPDLVQASSQAADQGCSSENSWIHGAHAVILSNAGAGLDSFGEKRKL